MFHATFKTSFLNYKHRTTDFIAPEANDVKEVIKYLYTDEFKDFSTNIFINYLNIDDVTSTVMVSSKLLFY